MKYSIKIMGGIAVECASIEDLMRLIEHACGRTLTPRELPYDPSDPDGEETVDKRVERMPVELLRAALIQYNDMVTARNKDIEELTKVKNELETTVTELTSNNIAAQLEAYNNGLERAVGIVLEHEHHGASYTEIAGKIQAAKQT